MDRFGKLRGHSQTVMLGCATRDLRYGDLQKSALLNHVIGKVRQYKRLRADRESGIPRYSA